MGFKSVGQPTGEGLQPHPFNQIKAREIVYTVLLAIVISVFLIEGLSRLTNISRDDQLWTSVNYWLTFLPASGWLLWRLRQVGTDFGAFFGKLPRRMAWGRLFGLTIATLIASLGCFLALAYLWYQWNPDSIGDLVQRMVRQTQLMQTQRSVVPELSRVLLMSAMIIAAPLCEEFLFRGLLLQRWATKWNFPIALLLTSALFGILHLNFVGAGLLGLIAGVLYHKTKTLWAPVALHAINNTIASLGMVSPERSTTISPGDQVLQIQKSFAMGWIGFIFLAMSLPWIIRFLVRNFPQRGAQIPYLANLKIRTIKN
jgi:uncharacterized protein